MYFGDFKSKEDICGEFRIDNFDGVVLFAAYEIDGYEGSADVIYVNDGKFYHVSGSHCSCYNLEDQWAPEEMPLEALIHIVDKGFGPMREHGAAIKQMLEIVGDAGGNPDVIMVVAKIAFG